MTQKNTRRAFLASLMALLLCISSLMGTTYAWFTDSVTSANNVITSGNLDIEFEYWKDGKWVDVKDASDVLTNTLWEPGVTEVAYLRVANAGSLSLKYKLGINIVSEIAGKNAEGKKFLLSDYIQFGVVEGITVDATTKAPTIYSDREAAVAAVTSPEKISAGYTKASHMASGDELYLALVVFMPTTVTNDANHDGVNVPKINLGLNVVATQYTAEEDSFDEFYDGGAPWYGDVDTSWYDPAATELTISSAEQLAGLAAIVNGGDATMSASAAASPIVDDFNGKTIKLTSDIDLNGLAWTPIGNWDNVFAGTFDGQGYTISNLYICDTDENTGSGVGFFGVAQNATIKNIKFHNVDVTGYEMVATVVGSPYTGCTISNCHVSGDVKLASEWAYVGGIVAYGYTKLDNCSVIAEGTGTIVSKTRNAVGGIAAWLLEDASAITNCEVKNLELTGWANIGAITGFMHRLGVIDGCSAENVTMTKTRKDGIATIGLAAGGWNYNASKAITITNNTFKNITLNGTYVANSAANILYGGEYYGNTNSNFVLDNNTQENITNNLIEVKTITDAAGLKDALKNGGDNYVLTADITVAKNETLTVANGTAVAIDLNGYTISSTADKSGNQELFLVKGDLTVTNGSLGYVASNNQAWNAMITIFDVTAGGTLTMDKVTATVAGSDMNFIVHLNNWGKASLYVNDCDFTTTYVAIRAFNSGYDMNTVTVKNTDFHGGRVFWVHNYTSEGKDDSTLTLDIYGNGNTSDSEKPVRFGFNISTYYTIDGTQIVTSSITVPVAPLEEDFLFPAGTNAVLYKDMVMSGDAQIVHTESAVLGLSNVKATVDHDLIVRKSGGAICISDCDFTLTNGAKLISVGEGGDGYQVFLINVTVNGELLTQENAGQYLEGISWFGAYPEWPNT